MDASGLLVKLSELIGKAAEGIFREIPQNMKSKLEELVFLALKQAYDAAQWTNREDHQNTWFRNVFAWANGEAWHSIAVAVAGAFGGSGGVVTTAVELPVTTTLILRSVQEIAASYGYDPADPAVRRQCLAVFALGGPLHEDDGSDLGFFGVRFAAGAETIAQLLRTILPRFGLVVSEKFLAQASPLVGAAGGAFVNFSFIQFFQKMAHVHFRLLLLEREYDRDQLKSCFERIVGALRQCGR